MKPRMVPSQNSRYSCENLSTFLSNKDFRKHYNKSLDTIKKYKNLEANNWFLSQCISEEIVPKSFANKNTIKTGKSGDFINECSSWTENQCL